MRTSRERRVLQLACGVADARAVIRGRTAGVLSEIGVGIGMTPRGKTTGIVLGNHLRVHPRPSEYPPARTLLSPSLVGKLRPTAEGTTDLIYRIAPGAGMTLIWVLAAAAAIFWLLALVLWNVTPVLPAAFFTVAFGVFAFLYLLTRTMKAAEDRAFGAWLEDVAAGCTQTARRERL